MSLCSRIKGATFATIDSETFVKKSIRCVRKGERAILFATSGGSGYENMVQKRLAEAGFNPDSFHVGPLPWGQRIDNLPIIQHNGKSYLQFIRLSGGDVKYYIGTTDIEADPVVYGIEDSYSLKQGLPLDKQVKIRVYDINNIHRIVMMGEEIFDTAVVTKRDRSILRIS